MKTNRHPADVIALVTKAGGSLSALARVHRMSPSSFGHSLRRPIPQANRAIARFLGVAPMDLWPEWFDEGGERRNLPRVSSHKPTARKSQNSGSFTDRRRAA